ncbi:uncharacterized protein TRUGW13939_09960 [Talaromyces rugulosus]|uniref:Uncharacterized protein n=1 Tax=Talaromyces rugulosus TaxID=121627 RepID=A0A7H8RBE6_TALRU|nr:uncharacterized protein TRUGW13939_09960 [Talaromyces rugulosus]QKX62795.1 hypothetical protein TRUGW13939_09960 [Talaromyces rugulosus]
MPFDTLWMPAGPAIPGNRLEMVIAVDFGTTFTAVAYAKSFAPNQHTVLRYRGPMSPNPNHDKVPSILRYDNGGTTGRFTWGFEARRSLHPGERVHECFKLGLYTKYEEQRYTKSNLSGKYPITTALRLVKGEEAEKLVVDYLSGLKWIIDEHFEEIGPPYNGLPRRYIFTVPATWNYKGEEKIRKCALVAGMGNGNGLQVISEPEAAAIHTLKRKFQIGLAVGNTFIICDAGERTVDIASYTIRSLEPIRLDGAAQGSSVVCGSIFLNRIFADYLQRKLKGYYGDLDPRLLDCAVGEFENRFKAEFTGDDDDTYDIPLVELSDNPRHGMEENTLTLSGKELRENVFDKVIGNIQELVRNQIFTTTGHVKAIFLAGGFGQSAYLKQKLELMHCVKRKDILIAAENR